ncbi:MAG: VIT1/CCC1 transporter family protein [Promethearchaeota archaeon]
MRLKEKIKLWKQYSKMADLPIIARRKFFNNCFDGALTSAGIISGFFILFILNPSLIISSTILITGFATALAIGISGLWGAFLSEEAERKKKIVDLKKVMAIIEEKSNENNQIYENREKKEGKTIIQKAENFATWIASIVDGGAPVLGATLPLIPFFFGINLTILHFIFSYIILIGLLIYLGNFLGKISGGGRVKYALHLVLAGIVTLIVSILLGSLTA